MARRKVTEGTTPLSDAVRRIDAETQRLLDEQARLALAHIKSRTLRGVGINERRFAPYRPSVAARKGRSAPVTLRDRYNMIPSLHVREATKKRREIVFRDRAQERIGRFHQFGTRNRDGSRRMAARPWFGLTLRYSRTSTQRFGTKMQQVFETDRRKIFRVQFGL